MDPAGSPCLCDTVAMVDCPAHGEHSAVGRGIDFSAYTPSGGANYDLAYNGGFGDQLRDVACLVKRGLGLRAVTIDLGNRDTHVGQGNPTQSWDWFGNQVESLSAGLDAFYTDLSSDAGGNFMNRVSVLVVSEFGRRAIENEDGGTDHGYGNVILALGGSVAEVAVSKGCGVAILAAPIHDLNPTSVITFDAASGARLAELVPSTGNFDLQGLAWRGDTLFVGDRRPGPDGFVLHAYERDPSAGRRITHPVAREPLPAARRAAAPFAKAGRSLQALREAQVAAEHRDAEAERLLRVA